MSYHVSLPLFFLKPFATHRDLLRTDSAFIDDEIFVALVKGVAKADRDHQRSLGNIGEYFPEEIHEQNNTPRGRFCFQLKK